MTGRSPAEVVFNGRQYRTRLPAKHFKVQPIYHQEVKNRDSARKQAMKDYADKKSYVSVIDLKVGDLVLGRQQRVRKSDKSYDATPYVITSIKGSRVTATREGKTIVRHKNFFKKLNHTPDGQPKASVGEEQHIISFPDFPINDKSDKDLQPTCTAPTNGERQDLSGQHQELGTCTVPSTVERQDLSGQHRNKSRMKGSLEDQIEIEGFQQDMMII